MFGGGGDVVEALTSSPRSRSTSTTSHPIPPTHTHQLALAAPTFNDTRHPFPHSSFLPSHSHHA